MIYSPSQTTDWTACPVYWDLTRRQGWQPRRVENRKLPMLLGQVAADVLAHWNTKHELGECLLRAADTAQLIVANLSETYGCTFEDDDPAGWLTTRAQSMIAKYVALDPLPPAWTIEHVEHTLVNHGQSRIDLGGTSPTGRFVADYKVKARAYITKTQDYAAWLAKTLEEYTGSPQMLHYVWGYSAETGEPVPYYYIILIVLEPRFQVHVVPYAVDLAMLQRWRVSATWKWQRMDAHAAGEPLWEGEHFTKYGRCTMWDLCFGGEGAKILYTQRQEDE